MSHKGHVEVLVGGWGVPVKGEGRCRWAGGAAVGSCECLGLFLN